MTELVIFLQKTMCWTISWILPGNQQRHTGSVVNLSGADFTGQIFITMRGSQASCFPLFQSVCQAKLTCCWLQLHIYRRHVTWLSRFSSNSLQELRITKCWTISIKECLVVKSSVQLKYIATILYQAIMSTCFFQTSIMPCDKSISNPLTTAAHVFMC